MKDIYKEINKKIEQQTIYDGRSAYPQSMQEMNSVKTFMEFVASNLLKINMMEDSVQVQQLKDSLIKKMNDNTNPQQFIRPQLHHALCDQYINKINYMVSADKKIAENKQARSKILSMTQKMFGQYVDNYLMEQIEYTWPWPYKPVPYFKCRGILEELGPFDYDKYKPTALDESQLEERPAQWIDDKTWYQGQWIKGTQVRQGKGQMMKNDDYYWGWFIDNKL